MTPAQSAKLVALLLAGFPAARITESTSAIYERMLADLDVDAATAGVERLFATAKFLPSIAEIRDAALTVAVGHRRPGAEAWGDVLSAVHGFGVYRSPSFSDPIVARAVQSLGWTELCNSEHAASDRAKFVELYDKFAATLRQDALSHGLPSGERYRQLRESGEARPLSEAVGRLLRSVVVET